MAYDLNVSHQQTRDELGSEADVNFVFKRFSEKMRLIHGPTRIELVGIGSSFILGHTINGVLGTSTLGDYRAAGDVQRIENANNIFNERFWLATYIENNSGSINYATGEGVFDSGEGITTTSIFYDESSTKKVSSATPDVPTSNTLSLVISADGWNSSASVNNNEMILFSEGAATHSFDSGTFDTVLFDNGGTALAGSDLRFAFTNSGVSSVTLNAYSVAYTTYS